MEAAVENREAFGSLPVRQKKIQSLFATNVSANMGITECRYDSMPAPLAITTAFRAAMRAWTGTEVPTWLDDLFSRTE